MGIVVDILWGLIKWVWKNTHWIGILVLILIIEFIVVNVMENERIGEELYKPVLEIVDCRVERIENKGHRLYVKIANRGSESSRYAPSLELCMGEGYNQTMYLYNDSMYPQEMIVGDKIPAGRTVEVTYIVLNQEEVEEGIPAMLVMSEYSTQTPNDFEFQFDVEEGRGA